MMVFTLPLILLSCFLNEESTLKILFGSFTRFSISNTAWIKELRDICDDLIRGVRLKFPAHRDYTLLYVYHHQRCLVQIGSGFSQEVKERIHIAFMVAKDAEIPFDELASALIEGFGRDVAKKVVPLEVIVKYYGSGQLETWKNLMGS